ncbi:MAG TPA: aldose 1-epimerase family protein [Candidatus Aphodomonas merdavium]|nr:aldose 1-epimerase family protein [Candidatus Aphodomonas merdavium]
MDTVTLRNGLLTAQISPLGAELQSLRDAAGMERLYQGDSPFWAARAPVLFPIAGALRHNRYTLAGKTYEMPPHGFVRTQRFAVDEACETSATFLCQAFDAGFPFDYAFRVRFTLVGRSLRVAHITDNCGREPFYFCVGGHEGYATPEGIAHYEVAFSQEEPLRIGVLDGNLLTHETAPIAAPGGVLALKDSDFQNDALVFSGLRSKSVTLRSRFDGRAVCVDFAGYGSVLLWTKPGAPFLCIEPWTNGPDYTDSDGCIEHKRGAICLRPGERDIREHTITVMESTSNDMQEKRCCK